DLSGLTKPEMVARYPGHMAGKPDYDWYFGAPGGETLLQMRDRAARWLAGLTRPTIAVAHGQIGKVIRGICLGLDDHQILRLGEPQGIVHVLENGAETIWQ
ncbi:histidine phosphatase family protein, partial [Roseibium sp.]